MDRVHEHDRAGLRRGADGVDDHRRALVPPVLGVDVPHDRRMVDGLRRGFRHRAVGRAHDGDLAAAGLLDRLVGVADLLLHRVRALLRQLRVAPRVVAELVSGLGHATDDPGIVLDVLAEEEVRETDLRVLRIGEQLVLDRRLSRTVVVGQGHARQQGARVVRVALIGPLRQVDGGVQRCRHRPAESGEIIGVHRLAADGERTGLIGADRARIRLRCEEVGGLDGRVLGEVRDEHRRRCGRRRGGRRARGGRRGARDAELRALRCAVLRHGADEVVTAGGEDPVAVVDFPAGGAGGIRRGGRLRRCRGGRVRCGCGEPRGLPPLGGVGDDGAEGLAVAERAGGFEAAEDDLLRGSGQGLRTGQTEEVRIGARRRLRIDDGVAAQRRRERLQIVLGGRLLRLRR